MTKSYPQFVNYFDMAKETVKKCDEERPRFHAFLKVFTYISRCITILSKHNFLSVPLKIALDKLISKSTLSY